MSSTSTNTRGSAAFLYKKGAVLMRPSSHVSRHHPENRFTISLLEESRCRALFSGRQARPIEPGGALGAAAAPGRLSSCRAGHAHRPWAAPGGRGDCPPGGQGLHGRACTSPHSLPDPLVRLPPAPCGFFLHQEEDRANAITASTNFMC